MVFCYQRSVKRETMNNVTIGQGIKSRKREENELPLTSGRGLGQGAELTGFSLK
jgi:hypothetical protein